MGTEKSKKYDDNILREVIRFEVDPKMFEYDECDDELVERFSTLGSYKPTYHDIVTACRNMIQCA